MSVEALTNIFESFASAISGAKGLGDFLVYLGFAVLLVIGLVGVAVLLARLVRVVFNLSPSSFLVFIAVSALVLVVVGVLLP